MNTIIGDKTQKINTPSSLNIISKTIKFKQLAHKFSKEKNKVIVSNKLNSLSKIASLQYGELYQKTYGQNNSKLKSSQYWPAIYFYNIANNEKFNNKSPNLIYAGQELLIPPVEYVNQFIKLIAENKQIRFCNQPLNIKTKKEVITPEIVKAPKVLKTPKIGTQKAVDSLKEDGTIAGLKLKSVHTATNIIPQVKSLPLKRSGTKIGHSTSTAEKIGRFASNTSDFFLGTTLTKELFTNKGKNPEENYRLATNSYINIKPATEINSDFYSDMISDSFNKVTDYVGKKTDSAIISIDKITDSLIEEASSAATSFGKAASIASDFFLGTSLKKTFFQKAA